MGVTHPRLHTARTGLVAAFLLGIVTLQLCFLPYFLPDSSVAQPTTSRF